MSNGIAAAWRILADSAIYRVRKKEAGNLVTSMTLALSLALPWGDLLWRLTFGVLLNLFVYLLNDCFDVQLDLSAPGRDLERTRFLAEHRSAGWAAVTALGAANLAVGALHGWGLTICFAATAVLIAGYSGWLKRLPAVDVLAMAVWGVTMAMVGFPLSSAPGWWLAGLLGILCMVTEVLQVVRDEPSDRAAGIRTSAVVFGPRACAWLARLLMVAASAYTALFLHRWLGLALLFGCGVPLSSERAASSWDLLRVLFGLVWLAVLAFFYRSGALDGWIAVG